jgi:lipid II isoglutaminyl synthase (glutamine-hydrolysing)
MGLFPAILVAKVLRFLTRLRGGGSAYPGWVLLKMVPDILERTLGNLPGGVIFVTGSNGKSTTTTMLAAVLRAHGRRVFTNPAGGNLPQGLASAVVGHATLTGAIKCDVAVLEVDEAYGPMTAALLRPDWVVMTNVQVDQLNRFGEPENVVNMMRTMALAASTGVVVNQGDRNLEQLGAQLAEGPHQVVSVAVAPDAVAKQAHGLVSAQVVFDEVRALDAEPSAILLDFEGSIATVSAGTELMSIALPAPGLHYAIDAAIAIGVARVILGDALDGNTVVESFHNQAPVYGRGETIRYRQRELALTMMKNLPSLQVNLSAMTGPLERVWIAVDEGTPDPSWIFDVDLGPIDHVDVISGTKAWQWVLLLEYRGIPYGQVIDDTQEALRAVVALPHETNQPVHAIVNYEQMMVVRRLAGYKELEGTR